MCLVWVRLRSFVFFVVFFSFCNRGRLFDFSLVHLFEKGRDVFNRLLDGHASPTHCTADGWVTGGDSNGSFGVGSIVLVGTFVFGHGCNVTCVVQRFFGVYALYPVLNGSYDDVTVFVMGGD